MFTLPKRLLALTLFAPLAMMPVGGLRAQWVDTPGPCGGYIHAMTSDSMGIAYVATFDNGIYRSLDGGMNWEEANNEIHPGAILYEFYSIEAMPSGVILTGPVDGGIDLSTNHGLDWQYIPIYETFDCFSSLHGGTYLGGTFGHGLLRSTDQGNTWVHSDSGLSQATVYQIRQARNGTVFSAANGFLYNSNDTGMIWNRVGNMGISGVQECMLIDTLSNRNYEYLFLGLANTCCPSGLYRSSDFGITWDTVLPNTLVFSLAQDRSGKIFASSLGCVYESTNSGATWTQSETFCSCDITSLSCLPSNDIIAASDGCGTFRRNENDSGWNLYNTGLPQAAVTALLYLKSGLLLAGTQLTGLWTSPDHGNSWMHIESNNIPTDVDALAADSTGTLFLGSQEGLFISTDTGITWSGLDTVGAVYAIAVTDSGSVAVGSDSGYFLLDRRGFTPKFIDKTGGNLGPSYPPPPSPPVIQQIVRGPNGDLFGDGSFWNWQNSGNGVWIRVTESVNLTSFHSFPASSLFITLDSFMYYAGTMVSRMGPSGVEQSLNFNTNGTLCLITDSENAIIVGTSQDGIYRSTDLGVAWNLYNEGNTNGYTACLARTGNGDTIFAGSGEAMKGIKGGGVFRTANIAPSIVNHAQISVNTSYSYPNPFSQSTQITFTSPDAGYADISIVNLLGEQVAHIFSGELDADTHNFTFSNTTGLPDGIYECLIRMNGHIETLPIVLIH